MIRAAFHGLGSVCPSGERLQELFPPPATTVTACAARRDCDATHGKQTQFDALMKFFGTRFGGSARRSLLAWTLAGCGEGGFGTMKKG
jgi:hypothetical protein